MNRRILWALTIAALLVFLCIPSVASADSGQTWTLSDVITSDGVTASGSFVYNAGTGIYSSINVVTLAGTAFPGATYTVVDLSLIHISCHRHHRSCRRVIHEFL